MSRRLIVLSPGRRGGGIANQHARCDAVLRRIEPYVSLLETRRPFEPGTTTTEPLSHRFEDGVVLELDLRSRHPSSPTVKFSIGVVEPHHERSGTRRHSLDLNCMGSPAPHLPEDPASLAVALTRMARACLDTMIGAPAVEGRFPFRDAMAGCAHEHLLARRDAVLASVTTASPWSEASCVVKLRDDAYERGPCPTLQSTTMLVMAHDGVGRLLLTPAESSAFLDETEDPMGVLRLTGLTASLPRRPPGDPAAPDLGRE